MTHKWFSAEPLLGGGKLVAVNGASGIGVEGVPGAKRGMVVLSASSHLNGGRYERGAYRLTQRAVSGTDLWYVQRLAPAVAEG